MYQSQEYSPLILYKFDAYVEIPQTIYQTGKKMNQSKAEMWKKLNPEFDYHFYDDDSCDKFLKEHYPNLIELYHDFIPGA